MARTKYSMGSTKSRIISFPIHWVAGAVRCRDIVNYYILSRSRSSQKTSRRLQLMVECNCVSRSDRRSGSCFGWRAKRWLRSCPRCSPAVPGSKLQFAAVMNVRQKVCEWGSRR